jgi:thymidylate synthase
MTMRTYTSFTTAWVDLIRSVLQDPEHEAAPRGMKVKEILGAQFKITNPRDRIPYISPARKYSIHYMMAELLWYLSGDNSTEWISTYAPFWKGISDDGLTANSAYGARIFRPHDRIAPATDPYWVQWNYLVEELVKDPDSRRAVLHIRSPHDSLLAQKDVPCTLTLQFFIRDDKLHQVASMRSTDIILGLAYDVPAFTMFQELLSLQLSEVLNRKISLGNYIHVSNSLHLYEKHFEMAREIIRDHAGGHFSEHGTGPAMPPLEWPVGESLEWLWQMEGEIRASEDMDQLNEVFRRIIASAPSIHWQDWAQVLVSHRAGKLGDKEARSQLLASTRFAGFHRFAKVEG